MLFPTNLILNDQGKLCNPHLLARLPLLTVLFLKYQLQVVTWNNLQLHSLKVLIFTSLAKADLTLHFFILMKSSLHSFLLDLGIPQQTD